MAKQPGLICAIDSQTLVWGVRQEGTPDQLKRARWLFDYLSDENAQIIVPSVVVAEYLVPVDPLKHAAVIAELTSRFLIMPFDVQCAALAARLFREGKEEREMGLPEARKVLRADALIIATAKHKGASVFYSGDKGCRTMATKVMTAHDLPNQPPHLFDEVL